METDSNNVNKNGKRGGKRRFSKSNGTDTDSNDVDENGKRLNTPRQRPRHILIDNNNNDDDDDDDDYEPSLESSPRRTIPFPQDRTPELESQAPSRGINLTATTSSQQDRTHELRLQIPARRPNLTASSSQSTSKPRRRKIFWTSDEIAALQEGLEIYQQRAWQSILVQFRERFHPSRTGMDLRDKAKNEIKQRLTRNEPLEAFKYAQ
ncbi:hypothetical protein BC941DRAFT_37766 [Chlamydoabsidia padenii]|nr:hypothetical protein BC941DRAFT_37766 [Chlamydoabsidia padenii]